MLAEFVDGILNALKHILLFEEIEIDPLQPLNHCCIAVTLVFLLMQKKCEMYWPENVGTSVEYGDFVVSLIEVERFGDYVQRTMKIRYSVNCTYVYAMIVVFFATIALGKGKGR